MEDALISTRNLTKIFPLSTGPLGRKKLFVHAVEDVNISIANRETLALVGESGCGKTTLGRLMLRLIEPTKGEVLFRGQDIFSLDGERMRSLRRDMQIIFQDPYASLDPRMRILDILAEPLKTHNKDMSKRDIVEKVRELLSVVGLQESAMSGFPHQFSGGQRQRIGIARALALNPEFVVCDEAVSALDVSIRAQILNLLMDLKERFNLTLLFITHDLIVVSFMSDRIGVMYLGKCVEIGPTAEIFEQPLHPYTLFLLSAVPIPDPHARDRAKLILKGDLPSPVNVPTGCRFHTRCPYLRDICISEEPQMQYVGNRGFACHFPLFK